MAAPPIAPASDTTHVSAPHSALAGPRDLQYDQGISVPTPSTTTSTTTTTAAAATATTTTTINTDTTTSAARLSTPSSPAAGMTKDPKMLFSDLYKSTKSPLARFRPQTHTLCADPDFDADLISKDKAKQKEAVKKYLASKIRNDWEFKWPRPQNSHKEEEGTTAPSTKTADAVEAQDAPDSTTTTPMSPSHDKTLDDNDDDDDNEDDDDDGASVYSTISEDLAHWRPRLEWWSEMSDDEAPTSPSAYRFDTPDAVGSTVQAAAIAKQAQMRRDIRSEEEWNPGLACFNARRNAWTGAKVARVKPKPPSPPTSPTPSRRMSFFRFGSPTSPPLSPSLPLSPTATHTSGDTTVVASSDGDVKEPVDASLYPVETLLPLVPPILPPANPMRASITPTAYSSIYDRIVVHSMTPSCPINLADILRSCVAGWKRDGEWPPRAVEIPPVVAVRKKKQAAATHQRQSSSGRRMSLGFLGRRESTAGEVHADDDGGSGGKGIRKSIQRALGLGHERTGSNASNPAAA